MQADTGTYWHILAHTDTYTGCLRIMEIMEKVCCFLEIMEKSLKNSYFVGNHGKFMEFDFK